MVLYKIGALIGGGGLLALLRFSSWNFCLLLIAALYFVTAAWVSISNIKSASKISASSKKSESNLTDGKPQQIIEILLSVFHSEGSLWLTMYLIFYKMGERGSANNFQLFLYESGFAIEDLGLWCGTVSQTLSIAGSFYGGYIHSRKLQSMFVVMLFFSFLIVVGIGFQVVCSLIITNGVSSSLYWLSIGSVCFLSFVSGVVSTLSFTLMMQFCKTLPLHFQTSHYNVFASVEIAGKLFFATMAGSIVDTLGITRALSVFMCLASIPVIFLLYKTKFAYKAEKLQQ